MPFLLVPVILEETIFSPRGDLDLLFPFYRFLLQITLCCCSICGHALHCMEILLESLDLFSDNLFCV